ncbi:hypothetical protein BJV78DRAFT_1158328 [Lactifluus subvellereus]|nr:hypothetical protein BJV78DRAFT_1158328 [Lactifluus subvellereus]
MVHSQSTTSPFTATVYKRKRDELEKDNVHTRHINYQENDIDPATFSPSFHHNEFADVHHDPYSALTTSRPCTPPPATSRILSPVKGIWNNTVQLLSPKKKRARPTESRPSCLSPNPAQPPCCASTLFVLAPYPGTEIEGIPDEDAPEYPEMTEWNGESTFWGPHHELEFFDDEDAPEWDEWPIEDIPDPEGSNHSIVPKTNKRPWTQLEEV